jgi:hypothetical protein
MWCERGSGAPAPDTSGIPGYPGAPWYPGATGYPGAPGAVTSPTTGTPAREDRKLTNLDDLSGAWRTPTFRSLVLRRAVRGQ